MHILAIFLGGDSLQRVYHLTKTVQTVVGIRIGW